MAVCPDFYDSDDSEFSDDGDYYNFKEKTRKIHVKLETAQPKVLTEAEQKEHTIKSLYSFICGGNIKSVAQYLDDGLDVNINIQDNWNPLLLAVSVGNLELTDMLLKRGANPNCIRGGCTALMMACNCPKETSPFENTIEVIKKLVEFKANTKAISRKRMTALMFAANIGHLEAVKYLLPLSNKDAEDNQKWTALFWAVNGNHVAVVQYLLEQGFDYKITDVRNNTPYDLAKNNDFEDILNLLPQEEIDVISTIIDKYPSALEEMLTLKPGQMPKLVPDIYNILCGVRCESVIKILDHCDITLYEFLSLTDEELKKLGVMMPFQRHRILGGIYKFHKYPFHPNSLHVVPLNSPYSNIDVAIQLSSTVKQVIAMQAALAYLEKNVTNEYISKEDKDLLLKNISNIRNKVQTCRIIINKLKKKTVQWDACVKPPDLIIAHSRRLRWPWRKIFFSFSVISLLIMFRLRK